MCGICGIYDFKNNAEKWSQALNKSNLLLKKRGPNNSGTYINNNIGLTHTRLSVIDTSESANQPLTDFIEQYAIVFNGEFYDYQIHRKKLEQKGYKFKSQSDTEVLLNLYIDKGETFLNEINGCFSLAIYNKKDESLFIARDRYGIKPLVYYADNDKIIFASEIKAILPFGITKSLNNEALQLYLYFNYIPAPLTIFEKVNKLLPGHFIKVVKNKSDSYRIEIKQYYSIKNQVNNDFKIDDAVGEFRNLLESSVKKRLISDVPLGTFLSGGIDSSIITAIASKHTTKLNTFSVGFKEDKFYDETNSAQIIANKFNTNHTVFSLSRNDLLNEVTNVLDYLDEPFADSSAIAVSALSRLTKQNVTVALSGDGADELHAGYNKHFAHFIALNGGVNNMFAKTSLPLLNILPKSRNSSFSNKARQAHRYAKGLIKNDKDRYWYWSTFADEQYVNNLLINNNLIDFSKNKSNILKYINSDFNSLLLTDMNLILPNDMLFKVDMMSMMHGLEVRVPMLDHTIVDFIFTLPSSFKIDKLSRKKLLRSAFADVLPTEIINKPKHGFEVPLLPWLKNELKPMMNDLLSESSINEQKIFNFSAIKKQKDMLHSVNPSESSVHLWSLLVFQYWWNKYLN
ncbi:MAG: asparagine synthase (glutamine-hydrolyzing) [Bacteroidetes bacterium CG02_land_8_20_14_3_00_31_25]|nr:asparagine synthase (glutamine-hydrolyzing) [Bacteroidota bacterium]PIV62044.1 MAG: asparagine synthase (glutamine-hydrolyzing) [Bacteroidetes bacterium CG02_land_8_20_14_3_00_31_25]PIX36511.1 MAG: asparagine synthase (glutamine-hydrolyzing) [Bacteroidetes bacterium CG_4_8_14_3_um_filter_31_14]